MNPSTLSSPFPFSFFSIGGVSCRKLKKIEANREKGGKEEETRY
jgi:hypothetical protein